MRGPVRIAVALVGCLLAATCGREPSAPSRTSAPTPSSPVIRLEIEGPSSVAPGAFGLFKATAFLQDGSTRDVTREAGWSSQFNAVLSREPAPGVFVGRQAGESLVQAVYARTVSREVIVTPDGTFRLVGSVTEGGLGIADALVEATPSIAGGNVMTNFGGQYRLYGVPGQAQIRVTKDGYQPLTQNVTVADNNQRQNFVLSLAAPRDDVRGTWRLTISAAAGCRGRLRDDVLVRTYTAALTQDGPRVLATLSGARFGASSSGEAKGFGGRIEPGRLTFVLSTEYYYQEARDLIEQLDDGTYFTAYGSVVTSRLTANEYRGTLNGGLTGPTSPSGGGSCYSDGHEFRLVR